MDITKAKQMLDKIIAKSRVHLYKPIQIAEILHRDRTETDLVLELDSLETYRNPSKKWRDQICNRFLGRSSTSSARYQDDLFNENAVPPPVLAALGIENRSKNGIVEAYIYKRFAARFTQMSTGLAYCTTHDATNFQLAELLELFWQEAGLRRSIDKVYEIIVYALFSALVSELELTVEVSMNPSKQPILHDFGAFAQKVMNFEPNRTSFKTAAKLYRVGVTNAADRGIDMWANFGLAIQIKHLSLSEEMAENIVSAVSADRIVIVCKKAEQKIIVSLLNQLGWKARIQSIVTENDLMDWYEKALRGTYGAQIGSSLLETLAAEIKREFPVTENTAFATFFNGRGYNGLADDLWM
jgi:HaeII restriction endonuclease